MSDAAQKTTPLYDEHVRLGAKMIPFGDWIMPVQYSGIVDEHQAVRKQRRHVRHFAHGPIDCRWPTPASG